MLEIIWTIVQWYAAIGLLLSIATFIGSAEPSFHLSLTERVLIALRAIYLWPLAIFSILYDMIADRAAASRKLQKK